MNKIGEIRIYTSDEYLKKQFILLNPNIYIAKVTQTNVKKLWQKPKALCRQTVYMYICIKHLGFNS